METLDWVVMALGVLGMAGYGWLLRSGRIPLRDERGQVRPLIWIGALGAILVIAGLLMNASA